MPEAVENRADVAEAELDPEVFEAEKVFEWTAHKSTNRVGAFWNDALRLRCRLSRGFAFAHRRCRYRRWRGAFRAHETQGARNHRLHLASIQDEIQHAFFDQKFGSLKSFRQLLPDRLFDHAWPG